MSKVILQSFDYRTLDIAHEMEPNLRLSVLIENRPGPASVLADLLTKHHAQILSPDGTWLTQDDVAAIHKLKAEVVPWTINTEAEWLRLKNMGVDGIITDNPKALKDWLNR